MSTTSRALRVDGLLNARDRGGLPRATGGYTARRVFFRSENLDRVTPAGWDQLSEAGVRSIVDLRAPGERGRPAPGRPATVAVDLDGPENREFWPYYEDTGLDGTPLVFLPQLAAMPERMAAVLTALARAPEGGVLFHCAAGRDRTGLTTMVLLSIVGVRPEAIVDDYLETARAGGGFALTTNAARERVPVGDLLRQFGTTTEQAMVDALEGLRLDALLERLSPGDREVLTTWRGHDTDPGGPA